MAVVRQLPCFSGAGIDAQSSKPSFAVVSVDAAGNNRFLGDLRLQASRDSLRPTKLQGFCDNGHLQYYHGSTRCGGKKEKEKEKEKEKAASKGKKKLKLLKGLSRDLSMFSEIGFGLDPDNALFGDVKGKMISEAADVLLGQLQQLRAEEKELKRKKKQEKAKLKAARMQTRLDCEASSGSSSESNDSEYGEVVNMSSMRSEASQPIDGLQPVVQEATLTLPSTLALERNTTEEKGFEVRSLQNIKDECCTGVSTSCSSASSVGCNGGSSIVTGASAKRIEVCMGGKCKKSGAAALLEEFEKVIGVEGAVVGCKCMGKCRDGPNVRVLNRFGGLQDEGADDSVRTPTNPLCIGVGLEAVGVIVANFLGEDRRDLGLAAAA